ncbi:hypothetical protein PSQ19_10610 [Devosia algicola]|uniref:Uncharacterized protein n=1 Tax=Devosia algicola TaxID=3026418 RepID=A0ABY7YJ68_9HYPH|nr:hypothetical protein [Devosia algicola]WDR01296.1 hypothetical protein PSQ19_10610 [Devosia algicola]
MLTNFTEFNRCRPDPSTVDYVTHGTTAIVHAADDLSVFQTLEALPQIFESAHGLAPGKPYRLGLTSIGARSNPYGTTLTPNPGRKRLTLTDWDPRANALFGAAWLVGVAAAAADADIELLTLAGAGGPFGVLRGPGKVAPSFHVLSRLSLMQQHRRLHAKVSDPNIYVVATTSDKRASIIVANGCAQPKQIQLTSSGRVAILDAGTVPSAASADWVERSLAAQSGLLDLQPYAVAFIELDALEETS